MDSDHTLVSSIALLITTIVYATVKILQGKKGDDK